MLTKYTVNAIIITIIYKILTFCKYYSRLNSDTIIAFSFVPPLELRHRVFLSKRFPSLTTRFLCALFQVPHLTNKCLYVKIDMLKRINAHNTIRRAYDDT